MPRSALKKHFRACINNTLCTPPLKSLDPPINVFAATKTLYTYDSFTK